MKHTAMLTRDWYGAAHPSRPAFTLALDAERITLTARVAQPALTVPADDGSFREGLWEGDCAELFLVNPATGAYVEFNLSPLGGWWCCAFTAPRRRAVAAPVAPAGVTTRGISRPDFWEAEIVIPLSALPAELAFDPATTRGNITFCLGRDPQRYLSFADLGGGSPDYHRPDKWIPLFT